MADKTDEANSLLKLHRDENSANGSKAKAHPYFKDALHR